MTKDSSAARDKARTDAIWEGRPPHAQRLTLFALTLGSGIAILDGSVVNVALPTIGKDLGASATQLTWVVNGYMLALASLVLLGGALGDRVGRLRIYQLGMVGFALGSAACALAPTTNLLIAMRVLQGVGAALATPGALAIIESTFPVGKRARAIGTWSGFSGIAGAIGPIVGGVLVQEVGWRAIFWLNVPLCVVVVVMAHRYIPETTGTKTKTHFDWVGGALTVVFLGALTFGLSLADSLPAGVITALLVAAAIIVVVFLRYEHQRPDPLVPPKLFSNRNFSSANAMTFLVYGAFGALMFFLVLQLQVSLGWTPLQSGLATVPITIAMMLLSARAGELTSRIGPRIPMTVGPLLCAVGTALLIPLKRGDSYWTGVLPGIVVFSLGLAMLVAPLTATVLASAPQQLSGTASGINNAISRAGSLLSVAALPSLVGLTGAAYQNATQLTASYRSALIICAAMLTLGGIAAWFGLPSKMPGKSAEATT